MKKLFLTWLCTFLAFGIYAQQNGSVDYELKKLKQELEGGYKEWVWKSQKLKFSIPATMKVTQNTANEFHAKDEHNEFTIFAWQDRKVTAQDMKNAVYKLADEYLDNLGVVEEHDIDDFEGSYVVGTDKYGHSTVFFGLIDKRGGTNFFVEVIFDSEDEFSIENAFKMVDSIDRL